MGPHRLPAAEIRVVSVGVARAQAAAAVLVAARTGPAPADLPVECRPRSAQEAYAIQACVAPALGPIGGWKVGVHAHGATPLCSPLPRASLFKSGDGPTIIPGPSRYRGLEGEIVFLIGRDLAPGAARLEVEQAIVSCHLAIEVIETRFAQMDAADPLSVVADLQNHEALVVGQAGPDCRATHFEALPVQLKVDEVVAAAVRGRTDDLVGLVSWLAHTGAAWAGGLKAGDIVTTGSWFPKVSAPALSKGHLTASGFPGVSVRFAG